MGTGLTEAVADEVKMLGPGTTNAGPPGHTC